jgi:hypothetical protein
MRTLDLFRREVRITTFIVFLFAVAMIGCAQREKTKSETARTAASRTLEDFKRIGPSMGLKDVEARFGPPDMEVGSGIYIYVYRLADGSEMKIGAAHPSKILYVRHGTNSLFELPSWP